MTARTPTGRLGRHRQRVREAQFRPVQFWVPNTRAVDFAEHIRQQCLKLNGDPAERDALRLTEEAAGLMRDGSEARRHRYGSPTLQGRTLPPTWLIRARGGGKRSWAESAPCGRRLVALFWGGCAVVVAAAGSIIPP
ncbi:MAG: antitoxin MazE family protein [Nevskiaceae bacterium]|nr:antitoxin MazE family protein [Nevskiaceae bacterium]